LKNYEKVLGTEVKNEDDEEEIGDEGDFKDEELD
jgi:hypothetical protein